jgi:hypothetical protein
MTQQEIEKRSDELILKIYHESRLTDDQFLEAVRSHGRLYHPKESYQNAVHGEHLTIENRVAPKGDLLICYDRDGYIRWKHRVLTPSENV